MDRLTTWNGKKWVVSTGYGMCRKIADKLAAYENIGLDPKELAETLAAYKATGLDPEEVQLLKASYEWKNKMERKPAMTAIKTKVHEHYVLPAKHGEHMDAWCERACEDMGGEEERSWCEFSTYVMVLKDGRIVSSY